MRLLPLRKLTVLCLGLLAGVYFVNGQDLPVTQPESETGLPPAPSIMDQAVEALDSKEVDTSILSDQDTGLPFSIGNQKNYTVGGIRVSGSKFLDASLVASVTGIYKGQKIVLPGDGLSEAIKKLWEQRLFSDIAVDIDSIVEDQIYLNVKVTERPRLGHFYFKGVKKSEATELKDKTTLVPNSVITGNTTISAIDKIKKYFDDKGYGDVTVTITQKPTEGLLNTVDLTFVVDKGEKVKVNNIYFSGNEAIPSRALRSKLKGTHERTRVSLYKAPDYNVLGEKEDELSLSDYLKDFGFLSFSKTRQLLDPYIRLKFFSSSKFNPKKYKEDKEKLLSYYNSQGYRDATLDKDTIYKSPDKGVNVAFKVTEGTKYYYGDIAWKGNTQYPDSLLNRILGINRGDTYNLEDMNERLGITPSQDVMSISSLYQDNGYLFYNITPVEMSINGDTINYEMRMVEGPQADIKKITISGNDKTNEHVARRELRTIPGQKFSRSDIIRSVRQISQLEFFDPQNIEPNPQPNPQDGTVDIAWKVEEKPADKLELSAGWGGYFGVTGTIGMTFNNFSVRNIFNKSAWRPLPSGDGQVLSVQLQSNGKYYSAFNVSFTEPWLGGKKRNPFSISYYHNKFSNPDSYNGFIPLFTNNNYMKTTGVSVSYGKQLSWPDDFFSLSFMASYERFTLKNYFSDPIFSPSGLSTGNSNNLYLRVTLDRNSTDRPMFPMSGSHFTIFGQFTPPYSLFEEDKDYKSLTAAQRFKFIEYQKYRMLAEWYFPLGRPHGKEEKTFVLKSSIKMGFIGRYKADVPLSPFERFELGGDGISNYIYYGKDIISQRGYPVYYSSDPTVNPDNRNPPAGYQGFTIFNKYTLELRYPLSLNPSSTIIALGFIEAANGYEGLKDYNPFRLRRSVGIGMRFHLPMFGLLGFDYGIGLDRMQKGNGLKNANKFSFMLGYEPD